MFAASRSNFHSSFIRLGTRSISGTSRTTANDIKPLKGMSDRLPEESRIFDHIISKAKWKADLYHYKPISTPILEYANIYDRGLGPTSDVIGKELYSFKDKNQAQVTLRPEGTAGIVRALLSNNLHQDLPQRIYYYGPYFRRENPQRGRRRQFEQFGIEHFGSESYASDVEVIDMAVSFMRSLRIDDYEIHINTLGDRESRHRYRATLRKHFTDHLSTLSEDSRRRLELNPLRILDSKAPEDQEAIKLCPSLEHSLSDQASARFKQVTDTLDLLTIPYVINRRLVRGLDYYESTIFEFVSLNENLGKGQNTVLAGGRYDRLVNDIASSVSSSGSSPLTVPAIGWAAGIDRLALIFDPEKLDPAEPSIAIIPITPECVNECLRIAQKLRRHYFTRTLLLEPPSDPHGVSGHLSRAIAARASYAVFVGPEELKNGVANVKDLESREQETCLLDEVGGVLSMELKKRKGQFMGGEKYHSGT